MQNNNTFNLGSLLAFDVTNAFTGELGRTASLTPQFSLTGIDNNAKLGFSFAIGNPYNDKQSNPPTSVTIAVAAPTKSYPRAHWWDLQDTGFFSVI